MQKVRTGIAALIAAGALLSGGKALAQQVIAGDLVVQGSLCTGIDCPASPSFGFDTIILRENNLRIFFDDTSVSTGFPANKWRITINDSASGGANFFSVDDATAGRSIFKVTAGAPANSLFVSSTGNVGLGTATPVLDLQISTGDTPAQRLEQTAAGGFTAQTWDVAGNEANFFVRDVTGGSRLPFRIRPGAPTSSIDIAASGNVGVGTATPTAKLDVAGPIKLSVSSLASGPSVQNNTDGLLFVGGTTNGIRFNNQANTVELARITNVGDVGIGTGSPGAKLDVNGTVRAGTLSAGATTVCRDANNILAACSSDMRLKRDVHYLGGDTGLTAIMQLKPAKYRWHDGDDRIMAGFIAQDTQPAVPEAVFTPKDTEFLSLDTNAVLSYAVKAIQELKADNDGLRREIDRLKARL